MRNCYIYYSRDYRRIRWIHSRKFDIGYQMGKAYGSLGGQTDADSRPYKSVYGRTGALNRYYYRIGKGIIDGSGRYIHI